MRICPACRSMCEYNFSKDTSKCTKCDWEMHEGGNDKRKAVYAGSFDPFTNGHLYIVEEASRMFDKVYILVANNTSKKRSTDVNQMAEAIAKTMYDEGLFNVCVVVYNGMIADFCMFAGVEYLIRGIRNTSDYLYEENIAKINHEINPALKTIYYRAQDDVISSSLVREFIAFGKDVEEYVPERVLEIIKNN